MTDFVKQDFSGARFEQVDFSRAWFRNVYFHRRNGARRVA